MKTPKKYTPKNYLHKMSKTSINDQNFLSIHSSLSDKKGEVRAL